MRRTFRYTLAAMAAALVLPVVAMSDSGSSSGSGKLFLTSAVEGPDNTVTLPLYRGTSKGRTVWYVVFDSSDGGDADALGVNRAQKLNNARGTKAVQKAAVVNGTVDFPASVNFAPEHVVAAGQTGFPPADAQPGSIGETGYSPLIQLPNGTIRNAPQIANATGLHDKVVSIDYAARRVVLRQTDGFQGGKAVKYVSTDASLDVAAALEESTYAPALNAAPRAGDDSTQSARASLAAFVNGQTGASNPERQGLNSALLDQRDPLNVLFWNPSRGRYSPLWDVFPAAWSNAATATGQNLRQTDFGQVLNLAQEGLVTGPGGGAFGAGDFVVNCPIVSSE